MVSEKSCLPTHSSTTVNIDSGWDELLTTMPSWNVFQLSDWLRIYASTYFEGAEVRGVLLRENDEVIGMVPIVVWKKFGLSIAGSPIRHSLTPYMGIACKGAMKTCASLFAEYCHAHGIRIAMLTLSYPFDGELMGHVEHRARTHTTSLIDLSQSVDTILKRMDQKTRNQVRQGEKNALDIHSVIDDNLVSQYLDLRHQLYAEQGMDQSASHRLLERFFSSFPREHYSLFSAKYQGQMVAAAVFLTYADTCLYWDGVSDMRFNRLRPNNVIQWHAIKWAKENEFRWYDLGGTNTPSIAHFKRGFGGTEKTYTSIEIFSPSILRTAWDMLEKLRGLRNPRLPRKHGPRSVHQSAF